MSHLFSMNIKTYMRNAAAFDSEEDANYKNKCKGYDQNYDGESNILTKNERKQLRGCSYYEWGNVRDKI